MRDTRLHYCRRHGGGLALGHVSCETCHPPELGTELEDGARSLFLDFPTARRQVEEELEHARAIDPGAPVVTVRGWFAVAGLLALVVGVPWLVGLIVMVELVQRGVL